MANSCFFVVVLLAIIKISVGDLSTCNYVFATAPPEGYPVAVNVCRQTVNNSVSTWRRYICNGTAKIFEEVYDNNRDNCGGNLVSTDDVTSSIDSFKCDAQGTGSVQCEYVMRKQTCGAASDPPTTYTVEPIVTGYCVQYGIKQGPNTYIRSFEWHCNGETPQFTFYSGMPPTTPNGDCSGGGNAQEYPIDTCMGSIAGLFSESKYCGTKWYGPTSAPTQEPTTEPTKQPTLEPTPYTSHPSTSPTKVPSSAPSKTPSLTSSTFYSSTTTDAAETTDIEHGSRIQIFGNFIFVSFIMIFMSFVL